MKLPRVPAGAPAPPIRWWGNVFFRVWKDWEQLVIVIRVPWWRKDPMGACAVQWYGIDVDVATQQLVLSWRRREGWRYGWRTP